MALPLSVVISGLQAGRSGSADPALARAVVRRLRGLGLAVVDHDAGDAAEDGVACVVHLGGATSSSTRLDDAVTEDLYETETLIAVAQEAGAPFVFASRLSAIGPRTGLIAEVDPRTTAFGNTGVKGKDVDVDAERDTLKRRVAFCQQSVGHADATAARRQRVRDNLVERGGPSHGAGFDRAVDDALAKDLGAALKAALVERAASWRFETASTQAARGFTRALGELIAAAASDAAADPIAVSIVRLPALLVSREPADLEDDTETAPRGLLPLLDRIHDGALRLPFAPRARVEALPLDVVADALVAVIQAAVHKAPVSPLAVVHVATADKNPLPVTRLLDLLDLHLRPTKKKTKAGGDDAVATPAFYRALSVDSSSALPPGLEQARDVSLRGAAAVVDFVSGSVAARVNDTVGERTAAAGDALSTTLLAMARPGGKDLALCHAAPFVDDDVRFAQRALRMTCTRAGLPVVDAGAVDWRDHLLHQHLPALEHHRALRASKRDKKPIAPFDSLAHLLLEAAVRHKNKTALALFLPPTLDDNGVAVPVADGDDLVLVSYKELCARACAAALRLEQAGVGANDRVVIAANNHPDWAIVAFGALLLRATLVPLDANIAEDACQNVVAKARPALAVIDKGVRARVGGVFDARNVPVLDLHLTAVSGPGLDFDPTTTTRTLPAPNDLASILFTSGTTGEPKGVMLTHKNFCALIGSLLAVFPVTGTDRMLSVLPVHHTFEFTCGLLMPLAAGATVYTPDAVVGDRVLYAMKTGRITAIVGVPALWQLLERRITKQTQDRGELASSFFQTLLKINKSLGKKFGVSAGKLLLKPVHDQFGGHLRVLISGGSALPPAVHEMFQGLGLPLAEGYGLTESAPVLTVAEGKMGLPAGTVGHAIPGVELRLVDVDSGLAVTKPGQMGEIQARAANVMQGYFENEAATDAVLTKDGWLKTGDLGTIDGDGVVRIVGRSKDVVVTAAGENIYLDDVEKKLEVIPHVFELTLLGIADPKGGERLACVFVASVPTDRGIDVPTSDPDVQQKARQALQQRIMKLPGWQRPAVVEAHDEILPRTASRKVKRRDVKRFLDELLKKREAEAEANGGAAGDNVVTLSPVRQAIARTAGVDVSKVQPSTSLPRDLGFDSLMWVELQGQLEPLAGVKLDPELLITKETVAEVELLVKEAPTLPSKASAASSSSDSLSSPKKANDDEGALAKMPPLVREALEIAVKSPSIKMGRAGVALFQETLYSQGFKTTIEGASFIPANRNVIVVANHTSHLDTGLVKYALGTYAEELRPLAAKDYFFEGNPLKVAFFENLTNLVPIDRETGSGLAFEQARDVVSAGHIVLIFPEGTRREDGTLGSFKPLVAKLALATGVDVLPLHLTGCFDAFPRGAGFPKFGSPLKATIGPPLPAAELARLTSHLGPVQAARAAAEVIRRAVVALKDGRALELSRATSIDDLDGATRAAPSKAG